ncbi:hypothetical protein SAMN04488693_104110 [Arthrobacter subterraneus]|uniref:Uncharacterized protein n=1 Tax=Arthrobacter subterraneus TaxID=335973 RepID=A0A1G8GGK5_9MICC|nr:hypothetical protein SAMN04488693_104110 [Arthrobacter subterraneus]
MSEPVQRPERVRVTAPQSAAGPGTTYPVAREMAEQSDVGELFVRSLLRSQLRLAVVVASGFLVILVGIPVLFSVFPVIHSWTVASVPVPWLLLGLGIYPVVIGCAVLYVRSAGRIEQRFRDLVDDQ